MNRFLSVLRLLAILVIAFFTLQGFLYQFDILELSLSHRDYVLVVCLAVTMPLLTVLVRELGHAMAAWWAGLKVMQVAVFGIAWRRADLTGCWAFRRAPLRYSWNNVVALAADGEALWRRQLIFKLGGVVAQLLVVVLCLAIGQAIFSPADGKIKIRADFPKVAFLFPNTPQLAVLNLFAIGNLGLVLVSLVPRQLNGSLSDGSQLLALLFQPRIEQALALAHLRGWLVFGVRPREWAPDLVRKLWDGGPFASEAPAATYLYYYHEDRGEAAVAEGHLLRAIESLGETTPVPSALAVEAAYAAGLHRRDRAKARKWMCLVKSAEVEVHTWERAEAAALYAEGQLSQAIARAEQGLFFSLRSNDVGGAKAERDWLQAIIDASRRALAANPTLEAPITAEALQRTGDRIWHTYHPEWYLRPILEPVAPWSFLKQIRIDAAGPKVRFLWGWGGGLVLLGLVLGSWSTVCLGALPLLLWFYCYATTMWSMRTGWIGRGVIRSLRPNPLSSTLSFATAQMPDGATIDVGMDKVLVADFLHRDGACEVLFRADSTFGKVGGVVLAARAIDQSPDGGTNGESPGAVEAAALHFCFKVLPVQERGQGESSFEIRAEL
jgi:hypothetical protein